MSPSPTTAEASAQLHSSPGCASPAAGPLQACRLWCFADTQHPPCRPSRPRLLHRTGLCGARTPPVMRVPRLGAAMRGLDVGALPKGRHEGSIPHQECPRLGGAQSAGHCSKSASGPRSVHSTRRSVSSGYSSAQMCKSSMPWPLPTAPQWSGPGICPLPHQPGSGLHARSACREPTTHAAWHGGTGQSSHS